MTKTKPDPFIDGLKATMRAVTPGELWHTVSEQGRPDFYRIVCRRAGLNPTSQDARRAFDELIKEGTK